MIKIFCSFADELPTDPAGFDLGDLDITGEHSSVTSKSKHPNQFMMLILSLVGLLDGLRHFLSTPNEKEFRFIGVDSSFSIVFRKLKEGQIGIYGNDMLIESTTKNKASKKQLIDKPGRDIPQVFPS